MEITFKEYIVFTDEELEELCLKTFRFDSDQLDSKVHRMLRYMPNQSTRVEAIRDVKESIKRIKRANELLPKFENLLEKLKNDS